jgi:antitoxin (DNA-binding transcriptional repressor) of toxin-antitoxin stability system
MTIRIAVPSVFRPLLPQVREGQRVLLVEDDAPVAELVPFTADDRESLPKGFDGDPILTADFVVPLPTDEFNIWSRD